MKNCKLKEKDIIFLDEVSLFEEYGKLYVYLWENDILDQIAELKTDMTHGDSFQINYYGVYDLYTNSFEVEINVTVYVDEKILEKYYPDICTKIFEYVNKNKQGKENVLKLTNNENLMIFNKFKDYCLNDFQKDGYKVRTFEELIQKIKAEIK